MKLYNPFKWHIIQDGHGHFYVRRFNPHLVYAAKDAPGHEIRDWWKDVECRVHILERAQDILEAEKKYIQEQKIQRQKDKAIKVIHD